MSRDIGCATEVPLLRVHSFFFSVLIALLVVAPCATRAQEVSQAPAFPCRDAWGEPAPCTTVVIQEPPASASPTVVIAPAVAPLTSPSIGTAPVVTVTEPSGASVYEREGAFVELGLHVASVDPRRLHLTPHEGERLPAVARGLLLHGESVPTGLVLGGFSLAFGSRFEGFLRFPEFRLAMYGGDVEAGTAPSASQGDVSATMTSFLVLRADLGLGLEAHAGPLGVYATVRAGIAGYFADVALVHATLDDFGRATLAEDALEVGWELAASLDATEGLSFQLAVEGTHLGAETYAGSLRVVGTY